MVKNVDLLEQSLLALKDDIKAKQLQRFFKTGKGDYGEGDKFLGITMPQIRLLVNKYYKDISLEDLKQLLSSKWHELRMAALLDMVKQYNKADEYNQKELYKLYVNQIGKAINNWDLIDVTCPHIIGIHEYKYKTNLFDDLLKGGLWHKRVAIISTFYMLKHGQTKPTYDLACKLVYQEHDLLHKAVGWSMREVGKVDTALLLKFLDKYASTMPRTALRYSIEKLPKDQKYYYMNLKTKNS